MIRRITTESGSVYTLDTEKKTWSRERGLDAAQIRTDSGVYIDANENVPIGGSLVLDCPPLPESEPGTISRIIQSTAVISNEIIN